MALRPQCNTQQPPTTSSLHAPLGPQGLSPAECVPRWCAWTSLQSLHVFGFLPHPPSVDFSVFPLHTQCCTPTDTPCDAEWSSRIATPSGEDQVCLNFFHPTFLLEILRPQLSEGTWLLPPQLMASTKNTWPGATDILAGVPPSLRVWDRMTGKGGNILTEADKIA